jgi:putative endonuclease
MTTTSTGRAAEQQAADFLVAQGFQIVERNWRNRWCELDIIARRGNTVHFVEVKYRSDTRYGFAAEYISRDKSTRLTRAALAWNQAHRYWGPYQIDVVSVEGSAQDPRITLIENAVGAF